MTDCPHCTHPWTDHVHRVVERLRCWCDCMWRENPEPPPPPRFSHEAQHLYNAFWEAGRRLGEDDAVHPMDHPYLDEEMDMIDTSGGGMPTKFWEHFADAFWDGVVEE